MSAIQQQEFLIFSVKDEGPGVSIAKRKSLFTQPDTSSRAPAVGLGLWISKNIAESLGGAIWCEPSIAKGAQFCFSIPRGGGRSTVEEKALLCRKLENSFCLSSLKRIWQWSTSGGMYCTPADCTVNTAANICCAFFASISIFWALLKWSNGDILAAFNSAVGGIVSLIGAVAFWSHRTGLAICSGVFAILVLESFLQGPCLTPHKTALGAAPMLYILLCPDMHYPIVPALATVLIQGALNLDAVCYPLEKDHVHWLSRFGFDASFCILIFCFALNFEYARQAAQRTRNKFLSSISHELRTPLQGALCAAELLLEHDELQDSAKEMVSTMYGCVQLLSSLINNVLDAGATNTPRCAKSSEEETYNVDELCHCCKMIMTHIAKQRKVNFVVEEGTNVGTVIGSRSRISQVLLNLLSNSVKVTEIASASISMTVRQAPCIAILNRIILRYALSFGCRFPLMRAL